jgi:IS5 family transposase
MAKHNGLFDWQFRLDKLSNAGDPLIRLNEAVDWEMFRPLLETVRPPRRKGEAGRPPYDAVLLFKISILRSLYNLSLDQSEFQILDRVSFMRFLGLSLGDRVPDANTIWNFEQALAEAELERELFAQFDEHLRKSGFAARKGQIVDASFVQVPRQRNSRDENDQIKRDETPEEWSDNKRKQKDTDARWTKKNGTSYFGYKNHVAVDAGDKFIRNYEVTDASVHDSQVFEELLDDRNSNKDVHGDSAYISEESEATLQLLGYRPQLIRKGHRGRPLSERDKQSNRTKSKTRVRVEHVFGAQHQLAFGRTLARTIGRVRTACQIGLRNLTYNLQRFAHLTTKRET